MKTDSQLQADVLNELLGDGRVAANEIAVSCSDGVVTLAGEVDSLVKRTAAARAAEGVHGARVIVNQIMVHLPIEKQRSDVEIAHDAVNALVADALVPEKTIRVRVQDGWIALVGEVESRYQRIAAQEAVEDIPGVRGITNLLHVKAATVLEPSVASDTNE